MDFGAALEYLKSGCIIYRKGWIDDGLFLKLQTPDKNSKMTLPYIYADTSLGNKVPYTASQEDILAEDWIACDLNNQ